MDKEIPGRSKCCKGEDTDEIKIDRGRGWQGSLTLGGCSAHTCWLSEKGRVCLALWAPTRGSLDPMPGFYCCCSVAKSYLTLCDPWTAAHQGSLAFIISWSWLKLMSIESVIPSNHLFLYRPLLLLPSIFPSIRVFSSELALHIRWPKYQSFNLSISPSNKHSGLISFRIDWFDLAF